MFQRTAFFVIVVKSNFKSLGVCKKIFWTWKYEIHGLILKSLHLKMINHRYSAFSKFAKKTRFD